MHIPSFTSLRCNLMTNDYVYFQMVELINLALQGNTCTRNAINLKYIVGIAYRINGDELNFKYQNLSSTLSFTAKQLEVIEADLMKHHTAQKAEHAMKILRAYHSTRTHQQQEADAVNIHGIEFLIRWLASSFVCLICLVFCFVSFIF